jgi:hypothetical protein
MAIYYKITNKDENHHGYKYKDGLNMLEGKFNENINDNCGKGGFYFTTAEYIHEFYDYGENLRVVELPLDNPNFKMVKLNQKFRANMIILKEKYNFNNLNDFKEIYKINTNYNCKIYNIEILEWLKNINYKFDENIINEVSSYGYVDVLEWFKNSGYEFKFDEYTIASASSYGHVNILEWFKNSGYEFKYNNNDAINNASSHGHVNILEWFKNFGYEFKHNEGAIVGASRHGHDHILEWFKNSGYEFKYNKQAIIYASSNGHVNVLEWFKNSGYEFKYDENAINEALKNKRFNVLEWFKNSGYEFKFDINILKKKINDIEVLEWFKNNMNYIFYYKSNDININEKTLEWLKINGVKNDDNVVCLF